MPTYALVHAPAVFPVDLRRGELRSSTACFQARGFGVSLIPDHLRRPISSASKLLRTF